jgi:hypothetical protein
VAAMVRNFDKIENWEAMTMDQNESAREQREQELIRLATDTNDRIKDIHSLVATSFYMIQMVFFVLTLRYISNIVTELSNISHESVSWIVALAVCFAASALTFWVLPIMGMRRSFPPRSR